ncbi:MAG: beta-galactosidase small subunit [Lachnospiraceae bacterium]|nr:beta-galactosidase small subunit [Lachnospiraceae bacterium]
MANTILKLTYGDVHLGIRGEGFEYLFSYFIGGPVSLVKDGMEWLYKVPRPAFWRALTDNDRGNFFHFKSGMWLAADNYIIPRGTKIFIDNEEIALPTGPENNRYTGEETAGEVKITYVLETITQPSTQVEVTYTVVSDGRIRVNVTFHGKKGLPELPVFGLRFVMPTPAKGFTYEGLSGETYPDRMDGGVHGTYEVEGLPMSAYLTPQECGMHMETDWVRICRDTSLSNVKGSDVTSYLTVEKDDKPFAFTALPYTPSEVESADHAECLPPGHRTVLTVCGAVRGVGGMDSWGADVEEQYHVSAEEDITFSFWLK